MQQTAAFFDLDNTLLRGTSVIHLGRGLHARGFMTTRALVRAAWLETRYRATGTENVEHAQEARDRALSLIAGSDVAEFAEHCSEIFRDRIRSHFCPDAISVADEHLAAGHAVWLVTASPLEIAELCAQHLGFTGGLGTAAERRDGRYTGRLVDGLLHGPAKATAVRTLADRHGYELSRAYAYSDSINDLPMLSLVAHPHAVNPDDRLRRYAADQHWPILDFHESESVRARVAKGIVAGATIGLAARAIARRG